MLKLVHLLCLFFFVKATTAIELDLLGITEKSFARTMELTTTAVKKQHSIMSASITPSNSQIQWEQLNMWNGEGEGNSLPNLSPVDQRLSKKPKITGSSVGTQCYANVNRKLDATLSATLKVLQHHIQIANSCVPTELDRNDIIANMVAAGCIRYLELLLPRIRHFAGLEFLKIANSCQVRLQDNQVETVKNHEPNTMMQL